MKLSEITTSHLKSTFRAALDASITRHRDINYPGLFKTCLGRAMQGWREQIVPEFGVEQAAAFEKALWRVRMRPETSIPWPMGFGYAFGAVCHDIAGGVSARRDEAAATSALAMFLVGLFDLLLDKYPREFADLDERVGSSAVTRYAFDRDLSGLAVADATTLAGAFMTLYRIYFQRCHRLLGPDKNSPVARLWHESLQQMHDAERASLGWRISKVPPTPEMVDLVETPGSYSYWAVALSACLGLDKSAIEKMEALAKQYIRLTRLLDSVIDVGDDIKNDIWGGMTVRLALEANTQADADRLVMETAEECAQIWQSLEKTFAAYQWHPDDPFTLADVLWAYLWTWAGGEVPGVSEKLNSRGEVIVEQAV